MKKIKYLLMLFLVFIGINSVNAFDTSLKVYDYAQVLTPQEETKLKESIDSYINTHNMDMALVTVRYHNKIDTMNYADDFYDYNGFGIGPNHDGVIFVIDFAFGYTDIWMSTTGKAINMYTDSRIDSILDSVANNKYNGYYKMFNAFIEKTNYYANQGVPSYDNIYYEPETSVNFLMVTIISIALSTIIIAILISRNKMVKAATTAGHYLVDGSVVINKRNDSFITTNTTSVRINDSSSKSYGSSSYRSYGGSSTHRSSSGRTHGGGGRRL